MWRRPEPALDWETVNGIILKLMDIDEKLKRSSGLSTSRRTKAKREMSPEEREEFREQKPRWEHNSLEFEAMYERLKARWARRSSAVSVAGG